MSKIDRINQRILQILGQDARIANTALAEKVGLSPSACLRRVQELERAGAIQSYRAVIAPDARGVGFVAYITVGLSEHTKAAQEAFERALERFDEVRECHNVTGSVEYILRVEVADLGAFKVLHTDKLGELPSVRQMTTHVVMGSPKDLRA